MERRRITSPILALTPENSRFVTLDRGTVVELVGNTADPGLRPVVSDGQRLLAFNRDLEERSERVFTQNGSAARAAMENAGVSLERERRVHCRYPIGLQCEYTLPNRVKARDGRTLNISAGGVLVESTAAWPASDRIDLAIDWPYLSDKSCPLQLHISGKIVRVDGTRLAVSAERQEFRSISRVE